MLQRYSNIKMFTANIYQLDNQVRISNNQKRRPLPAVKFFIVKAFSRFTHIDLLLRCVSTLVNRKSREVVVNMANINAYDESDNHELFTFRLYS